VNPRPAPSLLVDQTEIKPNGIEPRARPSTANNIPKSLKSVQAPWYKHDAATNLQNWVKDPDGFMRSVSVPGDERLSP
jgi:hypothetical protein